MAIRTVNGNTFTEDGWPLVDQAGCTWVTIPGTNPEVSVQVQTGIPAALLGAWEADWNAYIEPLEDATTGCWTEGNSVLGGFGQNNGSNHLGGTAVDSDWEKHPMGPQAPDPAAGFSQAQYDEMQRMKDYYTFTAKDGTVIQLVWWANDWDSPHDSMHSQMGYSTYQYRGEVQDWINTHIGADGFSMYRRGGTPPTPVSTTPTQPTQSAAVTALYDAVPVIDEDRAGQLVDAVTAGLAAAQCTNVKRIAMFLAQTGHESDGYQTTEEYADGSEYNNRADLGNTQPGDGPRFKGRTWIQITGRANYTKFSAWAADQGLISDPAYFVNNPTALADLKWAGVGAAWYWTVARSTINALSDQGDVVGVTQLINGGQNGIDDRRARYKQAIALGDRLLALINPAVPDNEGDDVLAALTPDEQHELLDGVRWLKAQLGPTDPSWGADSSLGQDDKGNELTVRDGLAEMKRYVEAKAPVTK